MLVASSCSKVHRLFSVFFLSSGLCLPIVETPITSCSLFGLFYLSYSSVKFVTLCLCLQWKFVSSILNNYPRPTLWSVSCKDRDGPKRVQGKDTESVSTIE